MRAMNRTKRRRSGSRAKSAVAGPAAAAAAAADAAADAAAAAADAATTAPRLAQRCAQRARSRRKRGYGVLPGAAAVAKRRAANDRRDAFRLEAVQLLQESAQVQAQAAVYHAKVTEFIARSGVQRLHTAAAAAAAAAVAEKEDDDTEQDGLEHDTDGDDDDSADADGDDDGDDAYASKRECAAAITADRKERAAALSTRRRGSKLTQTEVNQLLLHVHERRRQGDTKEAAIKLVAEVHGTGRDTLRRLCAAHDPHDAGVALPMSAAAPEAPNGAGGRPYQQLRTAQIDCIRRRVAAAHKEERSVMYTELYQLVRSDLPHLPLPSISTFRRRLKQDHGIRFLRNGVVVPRPEATANSAALRAEFVMQLSQAYEEEAAGKAVVIWFDESYCHTHHRRKGTLVDMHDTKQFVERRRAAPAASMRTNGGGVMFIVLHAASKDGLVVTRDEKGQPIRVGENDNRTKPTAEWVYRSNRKVSDSDYHAHITADAICQWLTRRLFPAVRELFRGRRIWLVADNARTHKAMPSDWLNPKKASKKAIGQFLHERGVRTLTVRDAAGRITARFDHKTWGSPSPNGPSVLEMRDYLTRWYCDRPDTALTRVQLLLREEVRRSCTSNCHRY